MFLDINTGVLCGTKCFTRKELALWSFKGLAKMLGEKKSVLSQLRGSQLIHLTYLERVFSIFSDIELFGNPRMLRIKNQHQSREALGEICAFTNWTMRFGCHYMTDFTGFAFCHLNHHGFTISE